MVHESFACRRGKGTHAALDHAQGLVRRVEGDQSPDAVFSDVRDVFARELPPLREPP